MPVECGIDNPLKHNLLIDGTFYLRNENTIGFAEVIFALGNPGDILIAGNWNGTP